MKNTIFKFQSISLFTFVLLLSCLMLTSCGKEDDDRGTSDPCANVSCLNGGTVDNYCDCDCPSGYSGASCQNYDPCYGINCQNGGTCINGDCDCPTGFYGEFCQYAQTPIGVYITRIDLMEWPEYQNNGSLWDSNSGRPDIYLELRVNGSTVSTSYYIEQCNLANDYMYTDVGFPIYLNNTSSKFTVMLWDYDGQNNNPQSMGGIYFYPDNYQSTLPETRIMSNTDAEIKYKVYFDWIF